MQGRQFRSTVLLNASRDNHEEGIIAMNIRSASIAPVRIQEFDDEVSGGGRSTPTIDLQRAQSQIVQVNNNGNNSLEVHKPTV